MLVCGVVIFLAMLVLAKCNISKVAAIDFSFGEDYRLEYVPVSLPYSDTTMKNNFFLKSLACIALFAMLVLSIWAQVAVHREPFISLISPTGRFNIESVRANKIFSFDKLSYLRITDLLGSGKVYRSPLADTSSLEMQAFENDREVGLIWLSMDKDTSRFSVRLPGWKYRWQNIFISNTPYTVSAND